MSAGPNSYLDIGRSQLQYIYCYSDTIFIFIIICIYYPSFYIHSIQSQKCPPIQNFQHKTHIQQ